MIGVTGFQYQSSYLGKAQGKNADDAKCALATALREAIDKYIDKMTRGLFGLCEEEIAERIAEFKAKFYPEDGTDAEIAAFYEKLMAFTAMLYEIADRQQTESLFTNDAARAAENEMDCIAGAIRSLIRPVMQ